ncbi:hypothetical protein [Labrenzia sp. THAF82]|uniref:hypothetical protein n=1 Tax=Labrenzia sp. THAF82 TaxID=2587861 RepID=UPI001567846E|nr:hypothetical protein [Labrenzia sp. THAF82]
MFWKSDDIITLYWVWFQPHLAAMPDGNAVQHLRYLNQVFGLLTEADVQFLVLGCANGLAGIAALAAIARTSLNPDSRKQSKSDLFGDARWMRRRIMAKLSRKGVYIIKPFGLWHDYTREMNA